MSNEHQIQITVPMTISKFRIADLLCCALEGGSNYWYEIKTFNQPSTMDFMTDNNPESPHFDRSVVTFKHLDYPLNEGGALEIKADEDEDEKIYILNLEAIERGLILLATKYPQHWGDFLQENEDADTGDTFRQLCLFGDVIYG